MKTIEERMGEIANKNWMYQGRYEMAKTCMIELAADLQAEKEKEVALMKIFHETPHARELAELRAWKESALKVMPDFQKLGKLLGLPLGSDVSEQLVPAIEKLTKEVAELRETRDDLEARLGAIERSHNCDGDGCAVCYELSRSPDRSALPMSKLFKCNECPWTGKESDAYQGCCPDCLKHDLAVMIVPMSESDIQNLSVSSHFELDCGPIKVEPALLDEVKRVLGAVASCKLFYEESMDIDNHTTDDVNNLLTRLGGSHE